MSELTINVDRLQLLDTLRTNLNRHLRIVEESRATYRAKVEEALEERLRAVRNGEAFNLYFSLAAPDDYSQQYQTAIDMLEMSQDDWVELGQQDFLQLVKDQWSWQNAFLQKHQEYSVTAARLSGGQ